MEKFQYFFQISDRNGRWHEWKNIKWNDLRSWGANMIWGVEESIWFEELRSQYDLRSWGAIVIWEDDQNGRRPKWNTTKMEDDQNGRWSKWKTTKNWETIKIEDNQMVFLIFWKEPRICKLSCGNARWHPVVEKENMKDKGRFYVNFTCYSPVWECSQFWVFLGCRNNDPHYETPP